MRSAPRYVALSYDKEAHGMYIVLVGDVGESSTDVYARAFKRLDCADDREARRLSLYVLSVSNAWRLHYAAMHRYEEGNGQIWQHS